MTSLFEKNYFDVCKLQSVMELLGTRRGGEAYAMLHALHCIHYDKMPPELRARIPQLVNECLRQQDNVIEAADVAMKGVL